MNDQNVHTQWNLKGDALKPSVGQACPFAQIQNVMSDSCRNGHCIASFAQKVMPKKSIIVSQGQTQSGLIAVVEGVLKLSKALRDGRTQIVGLRFPGEIVTTRSLGEPWFATVEAVQDAVLCFLDAPMVETIRAENQHFDRRMHDHAAREIAAVHTHLVTIGRKQPTERLATFLLELEERFVVQGQPSHEISIPITRDEIGDYLGLESETVSRQFTRLKDINAIELLTPSRVIIRDREVMIRLSDGE